VALQVQGGCVLEAPNYFSYSDRILVPEDECHVITQDLEVAMESMLD
jgi:hypothetical protein